ncbi:MAG: glycosyltransferase [Gemmatales bacterium]
MKLVIQIPCFNEAETLPRAVAELRDAFERAGSQLKHDIDGLAIIVIDDGSTDGTAKIAHECGVDAVVCLCGHRGLARAFMVGIQTAVALGADIVVNTDADCQYEAKDVIALVSPLIRNEADIVIGSRPHMTIPHFSYPKRILQTVGSWVVSKISGVCVPDATSGFRAMTKEAALRLSVFNDYTYTIETVIQSAANGLRIRSVPITPNPPVRQSRLISSMIKYVYKSILIIVACYIIYRPHRLLKLVSIALTAVGIVLAIRYLVFATLGEGARHIHSVVVGAALFCCGIVCGVAAIIAYLSNINRRLLEEVRYLLRAGGGRAVAASCESPLRISEQNSIAASITVAPEVQMFWSRVQFRKNDHVSSA